MQILQAFLDDSQSAPTVFRNLMCYAFFGSSKIIDFWRQNRLIEFWIQQDMSHAIFWVIQ